MESNFVGHDSWKTVFGPNADMVDYGVFLNDKDVLVLRSILFFYKGEKTTLSRIRAHFTDHAVNKLVHDKFIEIK